ncbi:DEKNAAC102356 [Brettanomyces naardenensis]|uniref:DEKNAAC102356 n=1 Tax=Brettanomyces naardenensis TaxID=13370 RepID=A0A448YLI1_BRENA|nr:DEKNAAC102356 [Brettanomyces naardenensis]
MSSVLIVGAGSMGLTTGYHLQLAGANVTFLVRPHHTELSRPQLLYLLNDNTVKKYTGYKYITDPAKIADSHYDYVVITLDAANLESETGTKLTKTLGQGVSKDTKIILGTVGLGTRPWFLKTSGLAPDRVTNGALGVLAYSPKEAKLTVHGKVDEEALNNSDQAFVYRSPNSFVVDDIAPQVAKGFSQLYDRNGISKCLVKPAEEYAASYDAFPIVLATLGLLSWPRFEEIDVKSDLWKLTTTALKEATELDIHGESGKELASKITEKSLLEMYLTSQKASLPLDTVDFDRYHHGGKVNKQNRGLLRRIIEEGDREGKDLAAVKKLNLLVNQEK